MLAKSPRRRPANALGLAILLALLTTSPARAEVEVFEISRENTSEAPTGKEADGIIGDFVLRNQHIEALVSGNQPNRKANMSTNWSSTTPGCLYDLSVRGSGNDQLTYLSPSGMNGPISSVRIAEIVPSVRGVVATRTTATGGGHGMEHSYFLEPAWRYLAISSRYVNGSEKDWKVAPAAVWKQFLHQTVVAGIRTGDATNPPDKQGYATYTVVVDESKSDIPIRHMPIAPKEIVIQPGKEARCITFVAPGSSPAEAWGTLAALRGETGARSILVTEGDEPVRTATILVTFPGGKKKLRAYPDIDGRARLELPPGEYTLRASDLGRPDVEKKIRVEAGKSAESRIAMAAASRITFEVTSGRESPKRSPCKVQFIGIKGTPDPKLGVDINAHGCRNQYHSENGHFTQQLPPGDYRLVITHGIEFDHVVREVSLGAGDAILVKPRLERVVDTRGWVSTDFHNHSTPSGDNYCGTDDRVINLAAENVEFAPTTEHNRLYDWAPHIRKLGLERELATVVGIELTGPNAHLNAFPYEVDPFAQDGGAPTWQHDPRINAIMLRDFQGSRADRWIQVNHPSVGRFFRDRDNDGVADGGYEGLPDLIDAAEFWSLEILRKEPWFLRVRENSESWRENRTFAWLQLLNQGTRLWCVAVADAHSVVGNGVGGWRTYVKSSVDEPHKIDSKEIVRNARAGKMVISNGPFLDVRLDDGTIAGGQTVARGEFHVQVDVRCTDWIDVDRIQVLVNGRQPKELNFTRKSHPKLFSNGVTKFSHRIPVTLTEDAHIIVAAVGEGFTLRRGWGNTWESGMHPCAYTNPIFVDIDANGWRPNGDTLDYPLPTGKSPIPRPKAEPAKK